VSAGRASCQSATWHAALPTYACADENTLTQLIIAVASQHGRYGYRRITTLLQLAGVKFSKNREERIWRYEGLKVSQKQKPRDRLWP
jgi:putative transposase